MSQASPCPGAGPRILIDCGDYRFGNLGDLAMLQVTIGRLLERWPQAELAALTEDPVALNQWCPGVSPVPCAGRRTWFADRGLVTRVHHLLSDGYSAKLVDFQRRVRRWRPMLFRGVLGARAWARGHSTAELDGFLQAVLTADAVVVCGAGGITDHAPTWAFPVMNLLEMAVARGVPTAMFGHGLGPLTDPELTARAGQVLPFVTLLALREARSGPELAQRLGVNPDRVTVTGDDAVEPSFQQRSAELGDGLGVNLRVSRSAQVGPSDIALLRPVLHTFARNHSAPIVPLPISSYDRTTEGGDWSDSRVIRELLVGYDATGNGSGSLQSPGDVIRQAGQCRLVVTGAYHAAVFALSQGVPTICLARSRYFAEKFLGLAGELGPGAEVVDLGQVGWVDNLPELMTRLWDGAASLRNGLLRTAERQIALGRGAYRAFGQVVDRRVEPSVAPLTSGGHSNV